MTRLPAREPHIFPATRRGMGLFTDPVIAPFYVSGLDF